MNGDPVERDLHRHLAEVDAWEMSCEDVRAEALDRARETLRAHCDHVTLPADGSAPKEVGLRDDVIDQYAYYLWETEQKDAVEIREQFAEDLADGVEDAFAASGGESLPHWDW